ncbi:formin 1 [Plasmodium gaboni]|uniref:Formin 1 n=1 Tax=Plasmodium gaboni TaxID=647221 RepID=A0A151LTJ1_9APIC|nr:formin 1 [Plasmodium gaboni]KYO02503.1 formin 1 [Plasmodium gaboni]
MELNQTIKLATVNDIENDKNIDTLSLLTKIDLKSSNCKHVNCMKMKNINFEDSLRMNDEQIKVKEAVFILQNMENFNYSIGYSEIQNIRNDLRLFAVNSYHDKKYSDCLIQAIHSYMIAKKYYSKYFGYYLTGDMSTELILICKCFLLVQKYEEGKTYLQELKFLIDNTLLYTHKKGILDNKELKKEVQLDNTKKNEDNNKNNDNINNNNTNNTNRSGNNNYEEPVIMCGIQVLANILYIFADMLSLYKNNDEAENYFLKYLHINEKCYNDDSLNYSDALNDVCSFYIKIREYQKALTLCEKILNIRKLYFGDYNADKPSEIIADCYCNLGLLYRLTGNVVEALHKYIIAVDMRMRIHKTRHVIQIQDILFSFAIIMHQLNNFKMALQLYKEVYSFYKSYYGPNDMNTIMTLKLIEELEKDVMNKSGKTIKEQDSSYPIIPNYVKEKIDDTFINKKNEKYHHTNKSHHNNNNNDDDDNNMWWNTFSEKIKNISNTFNDVHPNLIEQIMNEKVTIKRKNPYQNISDKKTFLTLQGKVTYNDLTYSSIDAYKNMQSNKQFQIIKNSFLNSSSINRIKSLYADSWRNTLIPSTYILPFVETKLVDKNLIKLSECKDFQNAILFKRKILPIVNIPLMERGYVQLQNDQPIMICNEDAKILLNEWNIKEPFVDSQGKVINKYESLDKEFDMFIPILDQNDDIMLGFHNTPLLVPNPAIHHCILLNDPSYFDRYNRINNIFPIDSLKFKDNITDHNKSDITNSDSNNSLHHSIVESIDSDSQHSKKNVPLLNNSNEKVPPFQNLKKNTNVPNFSKKFNLKLNDPKKETKLSFSQSREIIKTKSSVISSITNTTSKTSDIISTQNVTKSIKQNDSPKIIQKHPSNITLKSTTPNITSKDNTVTKKISILKDNELNKNKATNIVKDQDIALKIQNKIDNKMDNKTDNKINNKIELSKPTEQNDLTISQIMGANKANKANKAIKNKIPKKKIHIFKLNNNNNTSSSSTSKFSREKYTLKKFSKINSSFNKSNVKLELNTNENKSSENDTLEKTNRNLKFKEEPIVKSAMHPNIKMDLRNNMKKLEQYSFDNFKREIYDDDVPSNNYTNSTIFSYDDENETVASFKEFNKGNQKKHKKSILYNRSSTVSSLSHIINYDIIKKNRKKKITHTHLNGINSDIISYSSSYLSTDDHNDQETSKLKYYKEDQNNIIGITKKSIDNNSYDYNYDDEYDDDDDVNDDIVDIYKLFDSHSEPNFSSDDNYTYINKKQDNNTSQSSQYTMDHMMNKKESNIYKNKNKIYSATNNVKDHTLDEQSYMKTNDTFIHSHLKDTINNIKNVNKVDISFKFTYDEDEFLQNDNVLSDNSIASSIINQKTLQNKKEENIIDTNISHNNLSDTSNFNESMSLKEGKYKQLNGIIYNDSNKHELYDYQNDIMLSNNNKITTNEKKNIIINNNNNIVEDMELSENEEFFVEMMKMYDNEKYMDIVLYNNNDSTAKNTTNGVSIMYYNKNEKDSYFKNNDNNITHNNNNNNNNNNIYKKYEQPEIPSENIFLTNNSIEELDSNLMNNKYKKNNSNNIYSIKIVNEKIYNESNVEYENEENNSRISSNVNYNRKEKNIYHKNDDNNNMNMLHANDNKKNIENINNVLHIKNEKYNTLNDSINISNFSNPNDINNNHFNEANFDDPQYIDGITNNKDHSHFSNDRKKKKKKKAHLLSSNKNTHISKLFTFFSKKRKNNNNTKRKATAINNVYDEFLNNDISTKEAKIYNNNNNNNNNINHINNGHNICQLTKPLNDLLFDNKTFDGSNHFDHTIFDKHDNINIKKNKKTHLFITQSSHGMEKPKLLNMKGKTFTLKKLIGIKKNVGPKKEPPMQNKELTKNANTNEPKETNDNSHKNGVPNDNSHKNDVPNDNSPKNDVPNENENNEENIPNNQEENKQIQLSNDNENKNKSISLINNLQNNSEDITKKNISKKMQLKIIPKKFINVVKNNTLDKMNEEIKKIENRKNNNVLKRNNSTINKDVSYAKSINDKLSFNLLKNVKFCKIGYEKDNSMGTLPVVHLLNENKNVIAIVPWQIDLTSFALAKSSIEEEQIRKLGLMCREIDVPIEDRQKQIDVEKKLLLGEGLKELGLGRGGTTPGGSVGTGNFGGSGSINLISGIDLNALKESYKIEKKVEVKEEKKESVPKKDTPKGKGGPKAKGGKKGPPAFMKGPPKNVKGALAVGKTKFSKLTKAKDEGKTKRFFWEALFENDIQGTLFEDKKEFISKIAIEKESVEKSFAKAVSKKDDEKETKIKKPKVIQLLPDSKREYNMSIALSKFNNYTFKEIRDAIMELNPKILNIDNTEVLLQYVPTPEEFEIVKEYIHSNGDLNLVDKPEQYVAAIIGVPLLKQRLESHYYALSFKENYENTLNPLENILEACEAIKDSNKLFTILFTILNVGNTLNYGDAQRGNAFGFKLSTLSKLNDIRSSTKPVKTLLQYICEIIFEKSKETLSIIDELRCIEKSIKTDKQTIDAFLQKLKLGCNKIKTVLEQAKNTPTDPLCEALTEFYHSVEPKIVELENFYNQTFTVFKDIALYLGYKEKDINTIQVQDFFKELWTFIQAVEFNRKTINEALLKQIKKQEKELANEKQGTVLKKKQNFTITKKQDNEQKAKIEKKTFKIF